MRDGSKPVAIVTGALSGIGVSIAENLVGAGFTVFGTTRQDRHTKYGDEFETVQLDVTNERSVAQTVGHVMGRVGHIDLLVNNAGRGMAGGAEESSITQSIKLFEANLFGVMRMTRAVLPIMRAQGRGRIVNISSILGLIPAPFQTIYASTKHALEGYSESLDHEVRSLGIRVVLVEPAYTKTRFFFSMENPDEPVPDYERARTLLQNRLPGFLKKADDPDVVGRVVVRAATVANPKLRYTAGKLALKLSLLRRLVPASMFDVSLRKQLGLE